MKSVKGKLVKVWMNKWRKKMGNSKASRCTGCECCCQHWSLWGPFVADHHEDSKIPKDVPKGHLVVYVGKDYNYMKRFVIKISFLNHPLFKALLDQARDEFDFTTADSKLCIPCDEGLFLDVVRRAASPDHDRRSRIPTLCL